MWTSTLELSPRRVLLTRILGPIWPGAYFSSFAPLQVKNLPRQPLPSPDWVRVRNRLAGVCGSDLHLIYGDGDFRIAPAALPSHTHSYPGHEAVGEVIEVGDNVRYLHVGDRVVLQSGPNCISTGMQPLCRSCASGNYNLCERVNSLPGPEPVGGGWSEEMLLHEQQLFRVPVEMNDEQAALLEPSAVAVHAVLRRLPRPGEHALIIGAGTIGLLTLQAIRALSPQVTVSVMARHSFQVEQATRMGAAHILYAQDSYKGVERATGAHLYSGMFGNKMLVGGYDVIYDTIGTQQTIHDSLRWTRAGGAVVIVGVSLHTMHLDLTPIWYQEINLIGTMGHGAENWPIGTFERHSTFAVAAELIKSGLLHPEKLITHRFALNNYREALFTATRKSRSMAIKVVFDYALLPASVVPNVRASARQRRPVTTTAAWPPEEPGHLDEATPLPAPPEEHFPAEPAPVPTELPAEMPVEEPAPVELLMEEPALIEIPAEEPVPPSQSSATELEVSPTIEEETPTITTVVPKPRRSRQSARAQKITEDIQVPIEDIGNPVATNDTTETLQE
jgi:2-desacetyl-2-hydroxyethyl bacteriochlorophyllide A dehydrogenase